MPTHFSLLVTGFLGFFLLETQALYALDLTSWATPSKLVQTMLPASLQKMAKTVLKPVSRSSASAEFLTRFRSLDQQQAQKLLKKTPSDVQVQAMREILLETYLYHQHDWQELFQTTQKIAEQLQLAGPQNQKLYQDFQAFLQSPQRFSESKDGFETLLWHTHLTLSAFGSVSEVMMGYDGENFEVSHVSLPFLQIQQYCQKWSYPQWEAKSAMQGLPTAVRRRPGQNFRIGRKTRNCRSAVARKTFAGRHLPSPSNLRKLAA